MSDLIEDGGRGDLRSRADSVRLVDHFYDRVRTDDLLGPIFNDIARIDWSSHLPKMYDFWESVLFRICAVQGQSAGGAPSPLPPALR